MPSLVHSIASTWLTNWVAMLRGSGLEGLQVVGEGAVNDLRSDYVNRGYIHHRRVGESRLSDSVPETSWGTDSNRKRR